MKDCETFLIDSPLPVESENEISENFHCHLERNMSARNGFPLPHVNSLEREALPI